MNYLISYDFSDTKVRTKLAKILLRHAAIRVQKSVFFMPRTSPKMLEKLKKDVDWLLGKYEERITEEDTILLIRIESDWLMNVAWVGTPQAYFDALDPPKTLWI